MLNKNVLQIVKPVMGLFFGQKQIDERSEEFGEMRSHFYFWNSEKSQHAVSLISLNCSILKGYIEAKSKTFKTLKQLCQYTSIVVKGLFLLSQASFFLRRKNF